MADLISLSLETSSKRSFGQKNPAAVHVEQFDPRQYLLAIAVTPTSLSH